MGMWQLFGFSIEEATKETSQILNHLFRIEMLFIKLSIANVFLFLFFLQLFHSSALTFD